MPLCSASTGVAYRPGELVTPSCSHEMIRTDKWEESWVSEGRVTDDFGLKTGPIRRKRMTTTYETYRCRRCGWEDTRSDTCWEMLDS